MDLVRDQKHLGFEFKDFYIDGAGFTKEFEKEKHNLRKRASESFYFHE